MKHIQTGCALLGSSADVTAESQQPSGKRRTDTSAQLGSQRSAGIHGAVNTLTACKVGVLGTCCDQCIHISLQRAHADCRDSRESKHQRYGTQITRNDYTESSECSECVTCEVESVHTSPFGDQGRCEQKADNHRNINGPGENAEKVCIFKHICHIVNTHIQGSGINLHQNIGSTDHKIILILNEQFECIEQAVLLLLARLLRDLRVVKFFRRKFLHGEDGNCVGNDTDDRIDDSNGSPGRGAASEIGYHADSDRLDEHAGSECEHESNRSHLHALMVVLRDKRCQCGISNVIRCIEAGVQQCIRDEEPRILGCRTDVCRNAENRHEAERASEETVEHPWARFSHLCVCLINQGSEENVAHAIEQLRYCDQRADHAGVHADRVGEEDHDKCRQQGVHNIARDVAGAVTDLVIPF